MLEDKVVCVCMCARLQELTPCYIYATWINTGAIACVETGGHRRPNNHANAALQMFRYLLALPRQLSSLLAPVYMSAGLLLSHSLPTREGKPMYLLMPAHVSACVCVCACVCPSRACVCVCVCPPYTGH